MKLKDLLTFDKVKLDVAAKSREAVIVALIDILSKSGDVEKPLDVRKLVLNREFQIGTGIGNGVAIPHCDPGSFSKPMVSMVRLLDEVDFHSPEKDKARLVFLLLTPKSMSSLHLRLIARICRVTSFENVRKQMLTASTNIVLANVIAEAEKTLPELHS